MSKMSMHVLEQQEEEYKQNQPQELERERQKVCDYFEDLEMKLIDLNQKIASFRKMIQGNEDE